MVVNTQDEKIVSEEQEKRFHELNSKAVDERTEEENTELQQLKDNYAKSARDRIKELTTKIRTEKTGRQELQDELERVKIELEEVKTAQVNQPETPPQVSTETVEYGGKKFYTNTALNSMIKAGKISQEQAEEHAIGRDEERLTNRIVTTLEKKKEKESDIKIRQEDSQEVLSRHPEWDKKNPNYNPDDELFKLTSELWAESYRANPKGFSLAEKRAKQILGIKDTPIDRSADLSVEDAGVPPRKGEKKEKEITLTADEEDTAVRLYTLGGIVNPKTQRPYTKAEAIVKYKEALKRRRQ